MQCRKTPLQRSRADLKQVSGLVPRYLDSLLPLAMPTCGEAGLGVYALSKEFAIRRVEHGSEVYSNGSRHLAKGTEVSRRRFFFVSPQALSFRARYHLSRQRMTLAGIQHLHSQGPVPVYAHGTEGGGRFKRREGANGNGGRGGDGAGKGTEAKTRE